MHLTPNERNMAVDALTRLPLAQLRSAVPESLLHMVQAAEGTGRASKEELAGFLLDLYGMDLLAELDIRKQLCMTLNQGDLKLLAEQGGLEGLARSRDAMAEQVAGRRWYAGKAWPRAFAARFGFPSVFAGDAGTPADPPYEDVEVFEKPPELEEYQKRLRDQVVEVLTSPPLKNRAILSLPTGAGKTRTVVEALVQALRKEQLKHPQVLWIAQSEELCAQAVDAFRRVWQVRGKRGETMRIHRLWGGRTQSAAGDIEVVVASIQKLYQLSSQIEEDGPGLSRLADRLGAVVVDEAHHAMAPSYTAVLEALGVLTRKRSGSPIPLIGLTATPYRSSETEPLVKRFYSKLLKPFDGVANPIERLERERILAKATFQVVPTQSHFELTDREREVLATFGDFPESFLKKVAADAQRNQLILERLSGLDSTWPVLFFGCSKEHACAMAVLLRRRGVSAAVVTADTGSAARRHIVEQFRAGEIHVLCNYGIFTTGFDAPQVRAVVVARPTTSVVLYEQMIGRGLRGPKYGGTDECQVMDFGDNLDRFGQPMAHTRFLEFWQRRRGAGRPGSE